jgi:general secretion pathway protein M
VIEERRTLILGGVLALCLVFAVWSWLVSPLLEHRATLSRDIAAAETDLVSLTRLGAEYKRLSKTAKTTQRPRRAATLFALLDSTAARQRLRQNIESLRPSTRTNDAGTREEIVEMRISGVPLDQFVKYLAAVEGSGMDIRVDRLNLRSHETKPLDADVVFAAPKDGG